MVARLLNQVVYWNIVFVMASVRGNSLLLRGRCELLARMTLVVRYVDGGDIL